MRDASGGILYIGKANDLAERVAHYFSTGASLKNSVMVPLIRAIDYIPCASERDSLLLERRLISRHQPFFNTMWKDDKTYPYLKVTLGEDFPRLLLTRRKQKDGGAYFGPFPKVAPVRNLLRYLWRRKLFPLRPCRWEFDRKKPLDRRKIQSCLYYHTQECPAPCAGRVSLDDYRRLAEKAVLFFRGDYAGLRSELAREMKASSDRLEYERAAVLRDNISALSQMGEKVRVQAVREEDVAQAVAASQAVTDLQKALGLARPPHHIECFDISHFSGQETVASMVCFQGGAPCRDHYRKFKIRSVEGIDDFRSMEEVVGRRYRRLLSEGAPLPDLVVIDGGKGQLKSALAALARLKLELPAASLAKRVEEVFLPGKAESLLLGRDRPALRLLQSLRDEAHRFAVAYHTLLRGKKLFRGHHT